MTDHEPTTGTPDSAGTGRAERSSVLASSAVMAAGTIVSRLSGLVRGILLAAALGIGLRADVFTIANTIPNMLYILLAGGVFNAVLVPQLVRAMKHDPDGGEAYTNRVVTLAALFLGLVSVALVVFAPQVMSVLVSNQYDDPALADQRASLIALARYCLPQVFFYGMFVLVGQILNARRVFGPMMWAPIANNVVSVAILVGYLVVWGPAAPGQLDAAYGTGQELLLGVGSTVGIAVQLGILVPYLRRAGFTFRPRFDFRDAGLAHTLRLGLWTVLFVVVNQIAYTVVVRLASSGTASTALATGETGTGYTVYSTSFLMVMVPHSVVTVSLATAILPRLAAQAAEGRTGAMARTLGSTMRTALTVVLFMAALMPVVAADVAHTVYGHGATSETWPNYVPTLSLFGLGILFFTVHYLVLRGFYAVEETRTVFLIQCAVAATNIGVALWLVPGADPVQTSPRLVIAYAASYLVGSVVSMTVLRHRLGSIDGFRLVRFLVRACLAIAPGIALGALLSWGLHTLTPDRSWWVSLLTGLASAALAGATYLVLARVFRIREVTEVTDLVARRVKRT